jgi:hypothetical protein
MASWLASGKYQDPLMLLRCFAITYWTDGWLLQP